MTEIINLGPCGCCGATAICQLCDGAIEGPSPIMATMTTTGTNWENPALPWCFNVAFGPLQLNNMINGVPCSWIGTTQCEIDGIVYQADVTAEASWSEPSSTQRAIGFSIYYSHYALGFQMGYAGIFTHVYFDTTDPGYCSPFAVTFGPDWEQYSELTNVYFNITNGPIVTLTL